MKKKVMLLTIALFLIGMVSLANAAIIDINAKTNTTTNPVSLLFDAGTYEVKPIGVADGGNYNAWNAWAGGSNPPDYAGWINKYSLSSGEFDAYSVTDGIIYATDLLALSNALSTSFSLTSAGEVNFFITDNPYWDNLGGISLYVSPAGDEQFPVPEPATMLLFGVGLVMVAGASSKKFKK